MKAVFKNPVPFITQAVEMYVLLVFCCVPITYCCFRAVSNQYTGYNMDWEPEEPATAQDAADYAHFLTSFADSMHTVGLQLTVAIATWNPIWY